MVVNKLVSDISTCNEDFDDTKRTHIFLCGEFDIDLLKVPQKPDHCTFYDIPSEYLPRNSFATRLMDHSATLIDNIFSIV